MRDLLIAVVALSLLGTSGRASAQVLDRYGSQAHAAPPAAASPAPTRVLTWAGKTIPQAQPAASAAPAQPAAWGAYPSIQGAYGPAPATPAAYPTQPPEGAPQPLARPSQPQGQPVTVAPQAFYPPQVMYYPQAYQSLTGQPANFAPPAPPVQTQFQPTPTAPPAQATPVPAPPVSTYPAQRPLAAADSVAPLQMAALEPSPVAGAAQGQGVRTYSIHRPYGKTPDPIPTPPSSFATTAVLVPAEDNPDTLKGEGLGLRSLADAKD